MRREAGDALVFLPGAAEIGRVARVLDDAGLPAAGTDIHQLFGMLSADEQDRALQPSPDGRRRVVLATDIAESSLTVEGVRIVVDGGLRKAPVFEPASGLTRLRTVEISRASAEQRAGRAGRQGPGVVYRLWSKGAHASKRAFDEPEIRQVDLAQLALELAVWGTPAEQLAFLDQPPPRTFGEGRELLALLGALDPDGRPTDTGRRMLDLPLHPRLARMVLAATTDPARLALAAALAALIEERDVLRGRPELLPADLATRLQLLADADRRHPDLDGRALATARRRAGRLRDAPAGRTTRSGSSTDRRSKVPGRCSPPPSPTGSPSPGPSPDGSSCPAVPPLGSRPTTRSPALRRWSSPSSPAIARKPGSGSPPRWSWANWRRCSAPRSGNGGRWSGTANVTSWSSGSSATSAVWSSNGRRSNRPPGPRWSTGCCGEWTSRASGPCRGTIVSPSSPTG